MHEDEPHSQVPSHLRRRLGRPRIPGVPRASDDETTLRKARQRLAKRSYRSRKRAANPVSDARAAAGEPDVGSTLSTPVIELAAPAQPARSSTRSASKSEPAAKAPTEQKPIVSVLGHFSDTALSRFPRFSPMGQATFDISKSPNDVQREGIDVTSLGYRIVRACFMRGIAAMSCDILPDGWTPSPLLLPLRIGGTELLVGLSVEQMQDISDGYWGDARYDQRTLNAMPRMFRIIEGDRSGAIAREAPPKLQRLQYGRTRTILLTTLPSLHHEFLEARDVEEYLEERGIVVRGTEDIVELALPSEGGYRDDGHELGDWTIFGQQSIQGQIIPSGLWAFTPSWEQYTMLAEGQQQLGTAVPDQYGAIGAIPKITISLDKLVENLVANANCLGPAPGITKANVDLAISWAIMDKNG